MDPPAPSTSGPAVPTKQHKQPEAPQVPWIALQPVTPQVAQEPPLNWSHFRPEFAGKPEKVVEVYLLHTNDWINLHNILEGLKVNRFHLTLVGEARLWYESLHLIANNWQALQNQFRQQYSKIGNTREQLFYVWRNSRHICD